MGLPELTGEALATLIGALIGGGFAVLAVVAQRWFQRHGKIRCIVSDFKWEHDLKKNDPRGYTFYIKVFNEREVGTGVRDVDVEFFAGNAKVATDRPKDTGEEGLHADYFNFPPRQWFVRKLMAGDIKLETGENKAKTEDIEAWRERMRKVMGCNSAKLIVRLPGREATEIDVRMSEGKEEENNIVGVKRWLSLFGRTGHHSQAEPGRRPTPRGAKVGVLAPARSTAGRVRYQPCPLADQV